MRYVSTRGVAPVLSFADVLLAGLADDGGLYVPETWPALDLGAVRELTDASYADLAVEVMAPFVQGSLEREELATMARDAYATFEHPDVVPLVSLGDDLWVQELFHGPTLAFKDVALQLVGRLFDHELARRSARVTIVGATSGDTGSAAIEACRDRDAIDIFILHPAGRVSEVQRRQMTTVDAPNVHNIAIAGTFDDCQDLVKAMFADEAFRTEQQLSAVNSINWARVMAQVVYYVRAALTLTGCKGPVDVTVPTGNFGNVYAGWVAQRMGTPIGRLVVGTNRNDILTRFFATATMDIVPVEPTMSPSMDIQVSSNLERLLFELLGRDGTAVAELLAHFRAEGTVSVDPSILQPLREGWSAASIDEEQTLAVMRAAFEESGMLLDPHTAVGVGAAREVGVRPGFPMVCLATAHPAKFPDAVERGTGVRPELPERLADLFERSEHFTSLPNDLSAVQSHIRSALR